MHLAHALTLLGSGCVDRVAAPLTWAVLNSGYVGVAAEPLAGGSAMYVSFALESRAEGVADFVATRVGPRTDQQGLNAPSGHLTFHLQTLLTVHRVSAHRKHHLLKAVIGLLASSPSFVCARQW